ncbi:MAG: glycosyltransferase family 4 protein [Cyanobacteria bacterium J069]
MRLLVASHTYIVDLNCDKLKAMAALEPDLDITVVVPRIWKPGGVVSGTLYPQGYESGNFRVVPVGNFSQTHQGALCFGATLVSVLRQHPPDIIQVEQGAKSLAYAQLITLNRVLELGAKMALFTWWNLPYELRPPLAWLESYNLRHTHGAIAGNRDAADILRQRGYAGPMTVLPQLGVNEQQFYPRPQPQLAAALGIQTEEFVVGYVGRLVPEKGLHTLAAALCELAALPWRWLVVGRGPLQDDLAQQMQQAGLGDRLLWQTDVPHADVPRYLNLMKTLVLPSETTPHWKEQFGHVLIEAMACRIPVIGSDSGEIPHVIGNAGLLFPETQVAALRDRLQTLMQHPATAADLAERGYQRAIAHYTNHGLAKQQLAFYRGMKDEG